MKVEKYIVPLIRASLDNDIKTIRAIALKMIRSIKDDDKKLALQMTEALNYNSIGLSSSRSINGILPQDSDSRNELLKIEEMLDIKIPFYNDKIQKDIDRIKKERQYTDKLISVGLTPISSILLHGLPGVGKTLLAKYLASEFKLKFASLDMASTISSYLGKTGQNLKKVVDYAKEQPTLLLLDEFDAIAKKRDDISDLGELKRIVNILLKELEDWPSHSILVAATNHPELLDKAIWRRFDLVIEIPLPNIEIRKEIIDSELGKLNLESDNLEKIKKLSSELTENLSPSTIVKICETVKKSVILDNADPLKVLLFEIKKNTSSDVVILNKKIALIAKKDLKMTYREIGELLDKSISAVQNYLKGED